MFLHYFGMRNSYEVLLDSPMASFFDVCGVSGSDGAPQGGMLECGAGRRVKCRSAGRAAG